MSNQELSPRQMLKVAFLRGCIARGITSPAAIKEAADAVVARDTNRGGEEKRAFVQSALGAMRSIGSNLAPVALLVPPAAGAVAGYQLGSKLKSTERQDDEKRRELMREYARRIQQLKG